MLTKLNAFKQQILSSGFPEKSIAENIALIKELHPQPEIINTLSLKKELAIYGEINDLLIKLLHSELEKTNTVKTMITGFKKITASFELSADSGGFYRDTALDILINTIKSNCVITTKQQHTLLSLIKNNFGYRYNQVKYLADIIEKMPTTDQAQKDNCIDPETKNILGPRQSRPYHHHPHAVGQ